MLKRMCCVVAASVLAMNGMAMGAVVGDVFTEDFESQTSGITNFPTPNAAPAPFWETGNQNYWDTSSGIYAAPYVGEDGIGGNAGKYYYLRIVGDANTAVNNWGGSSLWQFATGADAHPEEMILEWDMFSRESSDGLGPRISLVDFDSGSYRAVGVKWSAGALAGTSSVSIYDPSGVNDVSVATSLFEETWYNYKLIVNTNTNTVSLSVDGATPVATTYTPNSGGAFNGTPDAVEIYASTKHLDWFALDNLRLEVTPEPASLALMGIGGLLLLSRRRSQ